MLKQTLFLYFIVICSLLKAQSDSSVVTLKKNQLDYPKESFQEDNIPSIDEVFKPKISLGVGMLSFNGDLYSKHFQAPWTAKLGYDLNISQRLFKPLQLNFNILFGKLGANEWLDNRQENFQSEIRSGGLSLLYDFGNFIPDNSRVRPWVSIGVSSFEFLSKTDMLDKNGNPYFYWSDGSIKNIDEKAPNSSSAINIRRDYIYETDVREVNKDGFGKYQERAFAFPIGLGAIMKVTDRVDLKLGMQYYFTTTDYIDGITNKSVGSRAGTKQKDNFVYTSFALQYDLIHHKNSNLDTLPSNYFKDVDWLAIDKNDYDEDGVIDSNDKCQGTAKGAKVNEFGCELDDDKDGVPNDTDEEAGTPTELVANYKGVGLTDEYWQKWYDLYMDSTGSISKTEILENIYAAKKDSTSLKKADNETLYTIELARYNGPVPNEEMAMLLSVGDIKSTILPDNSTVLYTAGTYKEIANAVKRRDEFIAEGNKNAKIGYFKNGDLIELSTDDISKLTSSSNEVKTTTESVAINANSKQDAEANEFSKGDIVYRVQLGAYKNKISKSVFKNVADVVELKTDANLYAYATKGFKTIQLAATQKADLVIEGYTDAFITAYKDGKRIPMSSTKATMDTKEKENINEIKSFSAVDKSLVSFKIQLGSLKKSGSTDFEEKTKDLQELERQTTTTGMVRYTVGTFNTFSKADKYKQELTDKGFLEAFVIAVFKGEIISIQEAEELLK